MVTTVRVPSKRIQDAITRFGDLGTITAQNIDVQDRQGELDRLARRIDTIRVQLAEVKLKLAQPGLSTPERLRLELQRQRLGGQLNRAGTDRRAVNDQVRLADLERYRVVRRRPVTAPYRGGEFVSNPPPSSGGVLIGFGLRRLERPGRFGSPAA